MLGRTKAMVAALVLAAGAGGVVLATGGVPGLTPAPTTADGRIAVTVASANGAHRFRIEPARTSAEQERGLMYRTAIDSDGGMLFWPYPPDVDGKRQPPRDASFWMKNTPSALDILFIRPDGTIAHIAENAVPFDESPVVSGEPVAAVLELKGGRTAELGIAEGDKVTWDGR